MGERGLLPGELTLLGLLTLRPMHGYDMACFLQEHGIARVCPLEPSTLYSYLKTLEGRALVSGREERVGQRPPRRTYQLTAEGRERVEAWLHRPVYRIRDVRLEFLLKLFFLGLRNDGTKERLLADQVTACEQYLAELRAQAPASAFEQLVVGSKQSAAEATLAWLRTCSPGLVQGEERGDGR